MTHNAIASVSNLQTARILKLLREHEESQANAMRVAIQLGQELRAIKDSLGHGQWLEWLRANWPRSADTAENFMLVAANSEHVRNLPPETSVRAAVEHVREQRRQTKITTGRELRVVTPDDPDQRWTAEVADARSLPLADQVAGMVIFSPPYNSRLKYEGYDDWLPWEEWWEGLILPSLREAARVLVPGGRLCLNLANVVRDSVGSEPRSMPDPEAQHRRNTRLGPNGRKWQISTRRITYRSRGGKKWCPPGAGGEPWAKLLARHVWQAIEDVGLLEREQLTWVKSEDPEGVVTTSTAWGSWRLPTNPVLRAVAEPVYIADKDSHTRAQPKGVESDIEAEEFKAWTRNAWFIPNEGGVVSRWGQHPAPFPVELPRRLMKLYSWPGDLVVDSFMGLAATGVAALQTGRRFYGCDISEAYVERARRRLAAAARGADA